ncbi:Ephrin-B2a [Desmophyllum pertusum]|uniref:Ephrin-B2a n=1 Tax=Desmophyllum pertusum TaxID=174260 RepID=A0A9W9YHL8_9CNID|nr:Ephrin-B2a [Desmophyllum pertusum]
MEELYENLWMVDKQAYDACATDSSDRILMRCDTPLQLRYFTIVFQRFSAVGPDGLEFEPGKEYFFILLLMAVSLPWIRSQVEDVLPIT